MFRRTLLSTLVGGPFVAGCASDGNRSDPGGGTGTGTSLAITSPAFEDGDPIPSRFTCDGETASPELAVSGAVDEMTALALVVDDPDAPRDEPFVHWLLWNLPASTTTVPEGVPTGERALDDARQGTNDAGRIGYSGPCPPADHGVHTYRFHLHGLDSSLDLAAGADRAELEAAMDGHVVDTAVLTGTYERS